MTNERKYIVYIHRNLENDKVYVGITCQKPEHRWGRNGKNYNECPHFWHALQQHGWDAFRHEIVAEGLTHNEACAMEIELIEKYNATNPNYGYNISRGGDGCDPEVAKRRWQDTSYKAWASSRMRDAWKDPVKRSKRSE